MTATVVGIVVVGVVMVAAFLSAALTERYRARRAPGLRGRRRSRR